MSRLVAVGNRGFVVALAGVGAEPVRCEGAPEFAEALKRLALQRDAQVIFAPEPLMEAALEAVLAFRARSHAALIGLPLVESSAHPSLEQVRSLIEQATGARLI